MKMDKVAGSGNDEFYTPEYAVTPIAKYLAPPPQRISKTIRVGGRNSADRQHQWDLVAENARSSIE